MNSNQWDFEAGIEAIDLGFGYRPGSPLLSDWNASFAAGSITAITGPSGRGKSTLLYLLGLMLAPTGGEVRAFGRSAYDLPDRERSQLRANHFGFVFQDAALDPSRTVADNITETALYRGQNRDPLTPRVVALMERFGVD